MTTFLIILSIALAVLAVGQLMRVFEASAKLKGGTSEVPTDAENPLSGENDAGISTWLLQFLHLACC